jgi:hypothetical protein
MAIQEFECCLAKLAVLETYPFDGDTTCDDIAEICMKIDNVLGADRSGCIGRCARREVRYNLRRCASACKRGR